MNKFYVATAIPYVNDKPHIGHAMGYMLADVLARYHQQMGDKVFFEVGTDEHGTKIAAKAEEVGLEPQAYTDKIVPSWHGFLKAVNVSYTNFVRTTDPAHAKGAQYIWKQLEKFIYKGTYEGWYCAGEEAFVTPGEATANDGICPVHKKPYQQLSEENYFFKLSAFGDEIREAIVAGEFKIVPKFRETEILNLIESGLQDISISRPVKHLAWGLPVPDDEHHVMYVWFEALMNYLTVLGYPDGEDYKTFWPADVQVVGKDIVRFHGAIWPAMLIGLDLPLPKTLLVHGFVLTGGAKMSKSIGNVVDPMTIVKDYGVDALRYFFLRHIPTIDDGDFTWEKFETAYNNELANELGNLVQRVSSMAIRYQDGVIGELPRPKHDTTAFKDEIMAMRLDRALDQVWAMIRGLNVYLEEVKPWEAAKTGDTEHLQEILLYSASSLRQVADLLWPFLPNTSEAIKKIFNDNGTITPFKGVLFPKIFLHTPDPRNQKPAVTV
ncbi:MAG TPA: methionine--tRNA ligase [Patescibacteria group bacterium]|jgi:methionyl-tRNA synthetase|nr:methionine--tRNA ligase [Patescibacteria group bacterium]